MRANHDIDEEPPPAGSAGELKDLVSRYQATYLAWAQEATPEARDQLRHALMGTLTAIQETLREPLRREAHRWRRSRSFREITESLASDEGHEYAVDRFALHLFLHVLEELQHLPVSRDHDMVGLLVVIARRGMNREERRIYKPPRLHSKYGTPLPPLRIGVARDEQGDLALEVPDERSADAMERAISRAAQGPMRDAIDGALATIRSPEDRIILEARLLADPPQPYEAIAGRLGAGWTEAAVRQRYRRARIQLRELLKGYADDW